MSMERGFGRARGGGKHRGGDQCRGRGPRGRAARRMDRPRLPAPLWLAGPAPTLRREPVG